MFLTLSTFGWAYTKIGTIQRRLAWPLRKDDTQNREAFHIFCVRLMLQNVGNLVESALGFFWCPKVSIERHPMQHSISQ